MSRNLIPYIFILILTFFSGVKGYSQQSLRWHDPDAVYREAFDLLEKKQFASAQELFRQVAEDESNENRITKTASAYYYAYCALQLLHDNAGIVMEQFLSSYPESTFLNEGYFELARYKFYKRRYREATQWFAQVNERELKGQELAEFYFKSGYSAFVEGDFEHAIRMFTEIKDAETGYSPAAQYYFGHIAYQQGNNETALQSFQSLQEDPAFGPLVPYYIAQIYYLQHKYAEVVEFAPGVLSIAEAARAPDLARLIGESHLQLQNYDEAVPYLEQYIRARSATETDYYQLGYALYRAGRCDEATGWFERITSSDSLSQAAWYHLGECYLKLGQKLYARTAFQAASKEKTNAEIAENAAYQYALLAYELSSHPYTDAVTAINDFLLHYPGSVHADEVRGLLVNAFMTTRNYQEALEALNSIEEKSPALHTIYQQVALNRGIQLFNGRSYTRAINHFDLAIASSIEPVVTAKAIYWKADALFRQGKYTESHELFLKFLDTPGAPALDYYFDASYNLGYTAFRQQKYPDAISWFRKYAGITPSPDKRKASDALLRTADAYFISTDYYAAASFYAQAASGSLQPDYALFQQALSQGLSGLQKEKITTLEKLLKSYPETEYLHAARYELAKTYQAEGDAASALRYYDQVVKTAEGQLAAKAMLQQSLVHYNAGDDDKALDIAEQVVEKFPGTAEAFGALNQIQNIYVQQGRGVEFANYVNAISWAGKSAGSLDSIAYESAERLYMSGDCKRAISAFDEYIASYPEGYSAVQAHYYRGECYWKSRDYQNAYTNFNYVLSRSPNNFEHRSRVKTGNILYFQGKFAEAIPVYNKLEQSTAPLELREEARAGLMRSLFRTGDTTTAAGYATQVLQIEKLSTELKEEAKLILALDSMKKGFDTEALEAFKALAHNSRSVNGAIARYYQAVLEYETGDTATAEKTVFNMASDFPDQEYWLARAFILLADIYTGRKDYFQARATLQSIMDNYSGDELREVAAKKLKLLTEAEKSDQIRQETPVGEEGGEE